MLSFRNRSIAILGAVAATVLEIAAASPAHAETVRVRYDDLDLHTARGMAALRYRVKAAAADLCGPQSASLGDSGRACRDAALARAMASLPSSRPEQLAAAR